MVNEVSSKRWGYQKKVYNERLTTRDKVGKGILAKEGCKGRVLKAGKFWQRVAHFLEKDLRSSTRLLVIWFSQ